MKRSSDKGSSKIENNNLNRQNMLRATGAVGTSVAGMTVGSMSVLADDEKVTPLSNSELGSIVRDALDSSEVQQIIENNGEIGPVNRGHANGVAIKAEQESYRVVRIPFKLSNGKWNGQISPNDNYILWSDSEEIDTMAAYLDHSKSEDGVVVNILLSDGGGQEVVAKDINNGNEWSHGTTDPEKDDSVETEMVSGPCGWTQRLSWSCVEDTVKQNEDVSKACSTCAAAIWSGSNPASVVACGWCAYDLYDKGVSGAGCSLCVSSSPV